MVIANEIRNLADQSRNSIQTVGHITESMASIRAVSQQSSVIFEDVASLTAEQWNVSENLVD